MVERITRAHPVAGGLYKGTAVALLLGGLCALMLVAGASVASQGDSENNNCCYSADWACSTQNEWNEGYYAFVNGQCVVAPSISASEDEASQGAPAAASVSGSDNCCYNADWRCTTQTEWVEGFYSARSNTCHIMPAVWAADATPSVQATESPRRQGGGSEEDAQINSGYESVKVFDADGNELSQEEAGVIIRRPTRQELCDAGLLEYCDED